MEYKIKYHKQAIEDAKKLKKEEPQSFQKLLKLEIELKEHPRTGTGKPKPLSGNRVGQWSRRVSKKHRLVYEIYDKEVVVIIVTVYGHYNDK